MKIHDLQLSDPAFHLFTAVVETLYPPGSIRHAQKDQLDTFLHACFVAEENGRLLGRASLHFNPHLKVEGKKTACIGNYEFTDDLALSGQFIAHLFDCAAQEGARVIIGPMNGSTWENYRFSIDRDSPVFLLEPYHHLYYNEQFLAAGFEVLAAYASNKETGFVYDFPEVRTLEQHFLEKGVSIRSIDLEHYEEELRRLYPFTERAFSDNFLYSPLKWEEFHRKYSEAAKIIQPGLVLLAEDREGTVRGFIFAYTDLLNPAEKTVVVKTLARDPGEAWKGLGSVLANRLLRTADAAGYTSHIHAFMKDTNRSVKTSERFSGTDFKRYALYGKEL